MLCKSHWAAAVIYMSYGINGSIDNLWHLLYIKWLYSIVGGTNWIAIIICSYILYSVLTYFIVLYWYTRPTEVGWKPVSCDWVQPVSYTPKLSTFNLKLLLCFILTWGPFNISFFMFWIVWVFFKFEILLFFSFHIILLLDYTITNYHCLLL